MINIIPRYKGCETSVLPISNKIGKVKTSHPLVQSKNISLAETQRRRGEKDKTLIQWVRFIGCETSVLPISNKIGKVKTSHPLVQSKNISLAETQRCRGEKDKALIQWVRFIGCETSVLPISKTIGEVKTSYPLVRSYE